MARWDPDAEPRLRAAALELFQQHGFENVTAAQIAERAGLARRSFFRYFPDKREVLFAGSEQLPAAIAEAFAGIDSGIRPWAAVLAALDTVGARLVDVATNSVVRREIIAASPELQERERTKRAAIKDAIQAAVEDRGVDRATAALLAQMGDAVFQQAFDHWIDTAGAAPIEDCLAAAATRLHTAVTN
jgi:AcrR family transcriptional regulator